jgi:hypothetical protein
MPELLGDVGVLLESCSADNYDCDRCPVIDKCRRLWDTSVDSPAHGKARGARSARELKRLLDTRVMASELNASSPQHAELLGHLMR